MTAGIWTFVQFVIGLVGMSGVADARFAARVVAAVERLAPGLELEDVEPLRRHLVALEAPELRRWAYELLRDVGCSSAGPEASTLARRAWERAAADYFGLEPKAFEGRAVFERVEASDCEAWCAMAAGISCVAKSCAGGMGAHELALWTLQQANGERRLLLAQMVVAMALTGGDLQSLYELVREAVS